MYYEAGSQLKTHPNIEYDDGITHIFLYCKGKPNLKDISHSKKMSEMLKYILSGEKPSTPNKDIDNVDEIVTKIKALPEVTSNYMKQWDREQTLQREAFDKGEKNTNDIYSWLFDQGRGDDVAIATKNPAYYSKLSAEYEEWKNNNS